MGHNPLINFYRRLTPNLRTIDEHPLKINDLILANRYFKNCKFNYNHFLDLLAVPFRNTAGFNYIKSMTSKTDKLLMTLFPQFRKMAWTVTIVLEK